LVVTANSTIAEKHNAGWSAVATALGLLLIAALSLAQTVTASDAAASISNSISSEQGDSRVDQGPPLPGMAAARTFCGRTPCRIEITSTGSLITSSAILSHGFTYANLKTKGTPMKTNRFIAVAALVLATGLALHAAQVQQPESNAPISCGRI
jgi:hypothetical protein